MTHYNDYNLPIQTIFENDNYIIRSYLGDDHSSHIVISFTGIGAPERHNGTFFGAALAIKLNIPWIGIIDRHNSWYCDGNPEEVFNIVKHWIVARQKSMSSVANPKLVGFGISMGAYAVLKYSHTLNLDYVIAAAPQWSLDITEAPYDSHFKHLYRPFMKGMGIRSNNVHGRIYALYDPYEEPDCKEVEMLKHHTDANEIPICYAGHMVLLSLKGSRIFKEMLNSLDVPEDFRRVSILARRHNSENIIKMIERAFNHNPRLVLQAVRTNRFTKLMKTFSEEYLDRIWEIATKLARIGYVYDADYCFSCITGSYKTCLTLPRLMSWRGELICYSHKNSKFYQTIRHFSEHGSMVTLVDNMLFAATPVGLVPVPGQLISAGEGRYAIIIDDSYLSARDSEQTELVSHLKDWEEFSLLPSRH